MNYTPLFINLEGKNILLMGGGKVATAKARFYADSGAKITCIAPRITKELKPLLHRAHQRPAISSDLSTDYFLTILATNDEALNQELADLCRSKNLLFCNCSHGLSSTFIHPAILREGAISVAINSLGVPAISVLLKDRIASLFTPEFLAEAELLRNAKESKKTKKELNRAEAVCSK
jgi:siroheme synthase-like protein